MIISFKIADSLKKAFTIFDCGSCKSSTVTTTKRLSTRIHMLLKFKSNVNLFSLDYQERMNSFKEKMSLMAINYPTMQILVRTFGTFNDIATSLKNFRDNINGTRVAHINTAIKLISIIMAAVFYSGFHFVYANPALAIEKPCNVDIAILESHLLSLPNGISKCQDHMFSNANSENSGDTLTGNAEGNPEPSLSNQEGVTTMHGTRKGRYSLDSWETMRGSRNDCPPIQWVNKVTECKKDKMNECAKDAAEQQAIFIDTEALSELYAYADSSNQGIAAGYRSGFYNVGATGAPIALNESNILRYILMCQAILDERAMPKDNRWIVLPTWATFLLNNSDIKDVSMTGEATSLLVNGGRIGRIGNFMVYQSNLYTPITDGANTTYPIIFGHKSAISFASQVNDVEYFDKLENDIGKAMRGFQLYDWKVTKAESMGMLYAKMA